MPILKVLSPDNHIFQVLEALIHESQTYQNIEADDYLPIYGIWSNIPHHMMNSGWRQGVSDGREEGVKAIIEMLQELGMSREETQTKVHDKFSASEETVQEWLNKYWK